MRFLVLKPIKMKNMGNAALRQLRDVLKFEVQPPAGIRQAMGKSYNGWTEKGTKVTLCPIQHLSYPPKPELKKAVAKQIKKALTRCGKQDEFI